jgi:hypothetical protein
MNIRFCIERLVLDGLPVEGEHAGQVQAGVERELRRLLGERGLAEEFRRSAAVSRLRVGSLRLEPGERPTHIGEGIAHAVHAGIATQDPVPQRKGTR